jgi:hypothetical protein
MTVPPEHHSGVDPLLEYRPANTISSESTESSTAGGTARPAVAGQAASKITIASQRVLQELIERVSKRVRIITERDVAVEPRGRGSRR